MKNLLNWLKRLLNTDHNLIAVAKEYISTSKMVVKESFFKEIKTHSDFPALLSLYDACENAGYLPLAIDANKDTLPTLPTPFVAQIRLLNSGKGEYFTVVSKVEHDKILYFDPITQSSRNISSSDFRRMFTGVIFYSSRINESFPANNVQSDALNRHLNLNTSTDISWEKISPAMLSITLILLIVVACFQQDNSLSIFNIFTTAIAIFTTILLLNYEVGVSSVAVQQICRADNSKRDCNAVISAHGSKFLGLTWSAIGFAYFSSFLSINLFTALGSNDYKDLSSALTILSASYIPYSLFYQWRIVRQWCVLCLVIQSVLLIQFITNLIFWDWPLAIGIIPALSFVLLFSSFLVLYLFINRFLKIQDSEIKAIRSANIFKFNRNIFAQMLSSQTKLDEYPYTLGIVIGNRKAKNTILKVCNPYCKACLKSHKEIQRILKESVNAKVHIIFYSSDKDDDIRRDIVRHFMAIADSGNEDLLLNALDAWYNFHKNDYQSFIKTYRIDKKMLVAQDSKLRDMYKWCRDVKIDYTPTYFVNQYKLPEMYSLADMTNLLS